MKGGGGVTGVTTMGPKRNVPVLGEEGCACKTPRSCALVKKEHGLRPCRKNTRAGMRLVAVETPACGDEGIRVTATRKETNSGAFTLMHTAWVINRRSWRPLCVWKVMI